MSKKLISIIIPIYNSEKYISNTFDSLLNQTIGFENLEVIFVDDCSTDDSYEIISQYSKEHENVIAIQLEKNSGYAGKPRNVGIDKASAEYLMFLDSDDWFNEDACEVLYSEIISDERIDLVVGGYSNIFPKSKDDRFIRRNKRKNKNKYKNAKNDYILLTAPPSISSKIFRKKLLVDNDIHFPEGIPAQDLVFVCNAICCSDLIISLNDYLVYNRTIRNDEENLSVSQNIKPSYIMGCMKAYGLLIDLCKEFKVNKDCSYDALFVHYQYLLEQLNKGNINDADYDKLLKSEEYSYLKNNAYYKSEKNFDLFFKLFELNTKDAQNFAKNMRKFYDLKNENKNLKRKNKKLKKEHETLLSSNSWKITKPLRKIGKIKK